MEKILDKYIEKFNDNFPIYLVRGKSKEEIMAIIQKCIDDNKPYEIEINTEYDY